jgi:hypothetical protein
MKLPLATTFATACLLSLGLGPLARSAHADEATATCVAAYERGQVVRKQGKLTAAREPLLACAQVSCSPVLRTQCAQWVAELEQQTPTVVLVARGPNGEDIVAAHVSLDGHEIAQRLDGKAIPIDPGPHTFYFAIEGATPREETVLVSQGEHERRIVADFRRATVAGASTPPSSTRPAPIPVAVPILAGVAVAGFGTFAVAGLLGLSEKNALDARQCKPDCPQADVNAAQTKFLVADIGLGVGAVSLVVAAISLLTKGEIRTDEHAAVAVSAGPTKGGATFGLTASF